MIILFNWFNKKYNSVKPTSQFKEELIEEQQTCVIHFRVVFH